VNPRHDASHSLKLWDELDSWHFPYDCIIFLRVYLRTGGAIGAQRFAVRAFGERVILRSELSPDLQLSPSISATHLSSVFVPKLHNEPQNIIASLPSSSMPPSRPKTLSQPRNPPTALRRQLTASQRLHSQSSRSHHSTTDRRPKARPLQASLLLFRCRHALRHGGHVRPGDVHRHTA